MVAAIRRVEVDEDIGVPPVEHGERRARFGRIRLDVVAIQVESLRVRSLAHQLGPVLRTTLPLLRADALVAVRVVDRDGDQHDGIENGRLCGECEIPQQRLERFLSLDFPRVDVALHVDDRLAGLSRLGRRAHERSRRDHVRDISSLDARSDGPELVLRAKGLQRIQERNHIGVTRRLQVVRALGARARQRTSPGRG